MVNLDELGVAVRLISAIVAATCLIIVAALTYNHKDLIVKAASWYYIGSAAYSIISGGFFALDRFDIFTFEGLMRFHIYSFAHLLESIPATIFCLIILIPRFREYWQSR